MHFIARLIINAIALAVITYFHVMGIYATGWEPILIGALILGIVNAIIRPILILISFPVLILSLGLFTLIINAAIFYYGLKYIPGFHVPGFWAAFWGAILMSVISWIFALLIREPERETAAGHA